MAERYPYAEWRPLGKQTQPRMKAHDIICLHTMAGSLAGTDSWFRNNGYGGNESHFGVGGDGTTYQWQDLDFTADANYRGSNRCISIETEDYNTRYWPKWNINDGGAVPEWTDQQIERLADLVAWCCYKFDIPCVLIPDSKPGRRGIGYHRQGVPGYCAPGGELWSTAPGKVCPGDKRIAQIPTVIAKARMLLGVPSPSPLKKARESEEIMADIYIPVAADLTFRRAIQVEAGGGSRIAKEAWLCMSSLWGWTDYLITAHGGDGGVIYQWRNQKGDLMRVANNWNWPLQLPDGTRIVAIEGNVESARTEPGVSLYHLPL